jgi:AAA family ATP:ADP antiporter
MTDQPTSSNRDQSIVERFLSLFAEVRGGEGVTVVLMFVTIFLILCAYYVLKPVRDGLIISSGGMLGLSGAELKSYAAAAMALLLLGIVPAYGLLASKVTRIRLVNYCLGAVVVSLGVFFVLGRAGVPLGLAFFLWVGIVNVFLIAQFWSYANDIYSERQGKRLFAIIAIGGSLGAIVGPEIANWGKKHTYLLMLGVAGVLIVCALLYNIINRREKRNAKARAEEDTAAVDVSDEPLSKDGGFQLVFRHKYLLLIAMMILVANLVNTTGEYILGTTVETHSIEQVPDTAHAEIADDGERAAAIKADRRAITTGFYGRFYSIVNLCVFLIQAFLVSRIFKYLGVRTALFFLPVIAFGGYALIGALGGILLLRVAKTAENSTDYSLQNTVRQALFLPTSREAKYKAKAAIDTFFVRIGDAASAGFVALGIHVLGFGVAGFAFANMGIVVLWLLITAGIAREHKKLVPDDTQAEA